MVNRLQSSVYRLPLGAASKQTFIALFLERNVADFDLKRRQTDLLSRLSDRQGSSVVEQGTHKPLVGSSTLPPGMLSQGRSSVCPRNRHIFARRLGQLTAFLPGFPIRRRARPRRVHPGLLRSGAASIGQDRSAPAMASWRGA